MPQGVTAMLADARRDDEPISARLHVQSDGTARGTHIRDADTGEKIGGILGLVWRCDLDQNKRAEVTYVQRVEGVVDGEKQYQRLHGLATLSAKMPKPTAKDARATIHTALALLNSMILAGESHSTTSQAIFEEAIALVKE